jgi:hypothetical protein
MIVCQPCVYHIQVTVKCQPCVSHIQVTVKCQHVFCNLCDHVMCIVGSIIL